MEEVKLHPIGIFKGDQKTPAEAPRQASLSKDSTGIVELTREIPLESLRDLKGFDHIWLLYTFHQNSQWSSLVRPPRGRGKRGVFSTRSPYRPNPIGMSCVKLERIEQRKIFVKDVDLLDGTPILDIKPYLTYADSFPEATLGWIEDCEDFDISMTKRFEEKLDWLQSHFTVSLRNVLSNHLTYEPTNSKIKRVKPSSEGFVFSYKTWRFYFRIDGRRLSLVDVGSGYTSAEIKDGDDPYGDKATHILFKQNFE